MQLNCCLEWSAVSLSLECLIKLNGEMPASPVAFLRLRNGGQNHELLQVSALVSHVCERTGKGVNPNWTCFSRSVNRPIFSTVLHIEFQ